jgi:hypothetical protein
MPGTVEVTCPYCGEPGTLTFEEEESDAEFVQDCAVCCRPWHVRIAIRGDGSPDVTVSSEGD